MEQRKEPAGNEQLEVKQVGKIEVSSDVNGSSEVDLESPNQDHKQAKIVEAQRKKEKVA